MGGGKNPWKEGQRRGRKRREGGSRKMMASMMTSWLAGPLTIHIRYHQHLWLGAAGLEGRTEWCLLHLGKTLAGSLSESYALCMCMYTCVHEQIENHNSPSCEQPLGLVVKQSPDAQDMFRPIPGLISNTCICTCTCT